MREVARKLVHVVASVAAAAVVLITPPDLTPWLFLGTVLLAITIEELRRHSPSVGVAFDRAFGGMLRPREVDGITGATTLAAGFTIAVLLLPPIFAAAGIVASGIGDAAAALVGRRWGRRRILSSHKSVEGALACFAATVPALWILPGIGFAAAVVTALATAVFELLPLPFDDNIWLAPAAGLVALAAAAPLA